jgi:hypothetical protein
VPSQLPAEIICYAFEPNQSAACQPDLSSTGALVNTDKGNFSATFNYPPIFYWVDGLFVGDHIARSVVVMRVFNALFAVAWLSAVYLALAPGLRRAMLAGGLLTAVPLGVFLIPSVNPSGWAILSATTFLVSLLGYLTAEDRRRRIGLGVLAGVALLVGAGARADAAAYAIVAIAAAVILTWRRPTAAGLRRLAYPAGLALAAAVAFVLTGQSEVADPEASGRSFGIGRFVHTLLDIPGLWIGGMGSSPPLRDFQPAWPWGLGWLDTAMPGVVWVSLWGSYAAMLFVAVTHAHRRLILAVSLVAVATLLIPAYIQYLTAPLVGQYVQPRYILPLLTLLAITAMVRLDGEAFTITRTQRWIVVVVLAVANAAAIYANLRRYTTGNGASTWNLDRIAEWWWSTPISPLTVAAVSAVAFAAAAVLLTAELTTPASATGEPVDAPAL